MAQGNGKVSRATDQNAQRRSEGSRARSGALSDAKILALKPPAAGQMEFPGNRETLDKSGAILRASIASINGVVEHAWAADRQWKQLYWTGGGGLLMGALGALSILHWIG